MSSQGEGLGRTDVLSAYGEVKRKNKWVIPWIEDDNGLHAPEWWVKRSNFTSNQDIYDRTLSDEIDCL